MGIKPNIQVMPPRNTQVRTNLAIATPMPLVTAPGSFSPPATTWGARRQTRYYRALTDTTNAQSGYLRARAELAQSYIATVRAVNEVGELPEICENDTQVRRALRERDYVNARRELEEARYGLYATQDEVDKLRRPRLKKALRNGVAINALMQSKIDMEALGEDTTEIDRTLVALQQD